MEFSAGQIAEIIHGTVDGTADVKVNCLSKIEEGAKGSLCFLANPKYTHFIYDTSASVVIVNHDFVAEHPVKSTLIRVDDAYIAFATIIEYYNKLSVVRDGISDLAFISPKAKLEKNVYVGEFSYIGENVTIGENSKIYPQCYIGENCSIGKDTTLYPGAKIYPSSIIGNACTIHSGVVIGADGFGFAPQNGDDYKKINHIGNVIIEDNVEVGANTSIDRGTIGSTIVHKGTKLDNLIQIGHNVEIGENTVIVSQTGIAGSSKIGNNCMIAGQVGIAGHLTIADNIKIAAKSGVASSFTKEGITIMGSPALEIRHYKRSFVHFKNFVEIVQRLDELEKIIKDLKKK
jgi:UDP-3-O-[3-hydroxymyristoyl] glucosamine N-acyltransferase